MLSQVDIMNKKDWNVFHFALNTSSVYILLLWQGSISFLG